VPGFAAEPHPLCAYEQHSSFPEGTFSTLKDLLNLRVFLLTHACRNNVERDAGSQDMVTECVNGRRARKAGGLMLYLAEIGREELGATMHIGIDGQNDWATHSAVINNALSHSRVG